MWFETSDNETINAAHIVNYGISSASYGEDCFELLARDVNGRQHCMFMGPVSHCAAVKEWMDIILMVHDLPHDNNYDTWLDFFSRVCDIPSGDDDNDPA